MTETSSAAALAAPPSAADSSAKTPQADANDTNTGQVGANSPATVSLHSDTSDNTDSNAGSKHPFHDKVVLPLTGFVFPTMLFASLAFKYWSNILEITQLRPVSTAVEIGIFSLIPCGTFLLWFSVIKNQSKLRLKLSFLAGMVTAASIMAALVCWFLQSDFWTMVVVFGCALVNLSLSWRIDRSWEFARSRKAAIASTAIGGMVSVIAMVAAQFNATVTRFAEVLATSDSSADQARGLAMLSSQQARDTVRKDFQWQPTGSFADYFLHVNSDKLSRVYFELTGNLPFDAESNDTNMAKQYVGNQNMSLSLAQSSFYMVPNKSTFTGTVFWTLVIKNTDGQPQEARMKIHLPANAVVNGMTFWMDGKPKNATICSASKANAAYESKVTNMRDPALITDLGNDTVFAQCYPVPTNGETKLRISIAEPLTVQSGKKLSMQLPTIQDANFLNAAQSDLQVESNTPPSLTGGSNQSFASVSGSKELFQAKINQNDASASIQLGDGPDFNAALRIRGTGNVPIRVKMQEQAVHPPKRLVVVLDSGSALKDRASGILQELKRAHKKVPVTIFFASRGNAQPISLKDEIKLPIFAGGIDNVKTMVQACDYAGRQAGSAVLWIHGQQPGYDTSIYALSPKFVAPQVYEIRTIGDTTASAEELLKFHKEIGPVSVLRGHADPVESLRDLVNQWTQTTSRLVFRYSPEDQWSADAPYNREADSLAGHYRVQELLKAGHSQTAVAFGISKSIVTAATSAVVLEYSSDYVENGIVEKPGAKKPAAKRIAKMTRRTPRHRSKDSKSLITDAQTDSSDANFDHPLGVRTNYGKRFPFMKDAWGLTTALMHQGRQAYASVNGNSVAQVQQSDLDANPGFAAFNRRMYFKRFPAAQEAGSTDMSGYDLIQDQKSVGPGAGQNMKSGPVYIWPITVPEANGPAAPETGRSGALIPPPAPAVTLSTVAQPNAVAAPKAYGDGQISGDLFKAFSVPQSDTQFQLIQRYGVSKAAEQEAGGKRNSVARNPYESLSLNLEPAKSLTNLDGSPDLDAIQSPMVGRLRIGAITILCPLLVSSLLLLWYVCATREKRTKCA